MAGTWGVCCIYPSLHPWLIQLAPSRSLQENQLQVQGHWMAELFLGAWPCALPNCSAKSALETLLQACLWRQAASSVGYHTRRAYIFSWIANRVGIRVWNAVLPTAGGSATSHLSLFACCCSCCLRNSAMQSTQFACAVGSGKYNRQPRVGSSSALESIHESIWTWLTTCSDKCAQGHCPWIGSWTITAM